MKDLIIKELKESAAIKEMLAEKSADIIADAARRIITVFKSGGKLLIVGNGGSAADAQHIATEFVGKLTMKRKALPAIALTTDTSLLTALGNDDGFSHVFSRQIEALADKGDILLAITTSGVSPNILNAIKTAHAKGVTTIGLTGKKGANMTADLNIVVPSEDTQRIQEAHITIGHIICHLVEDGLFQ